MVKFIGVTVFSTAVAVSGIAIGYFIGKKDGKREGSKAIVIANTTLKLAQCFYDIGTKNIINECFKNAGYSEGE